MERTGDSNCVPVSRSTEAVFIWLSERETAFFCSSPAQQTYFPEFLFRSLPKPYIMY